MLWKHEHHTKERQLKSAETPIEVVTGRTSCLAPNESNTPKHTTNSKEGVVISGSGNPDLDGLFFKDGGFCKDIEGKDPMSLIPLYELRQVSQVMADGAKEYGVNNWKIGTDWTVYIDAALRHITDWLDGEDEDEKSGHGPLAHAVADLLITMWYISNDVGQDDRNRIDR